MSIAQTVKETIEKLCPECFSLYAGYGMNEGDYVRWPSGVQELEKRNDKGRVSHARYRFTDGSTLTYKRKPDGNYTLSVGGIN